MDLFLNVLSAHLLGRGRNLHRLEEKGMLPFFFVFSVPFSFSAFAGHAIVIDFTGHGRGLNSFGRVFGGLVGVTKRFGAWF